MVLSRSENMARIRGALTKPGVALGKALRAAGIHARANVRGIPGRPDLALKKAKLVIFVDGCFWHGCPEHYVRPRTRPDFWANKLRENTARDVQQTNALLNSGWVVLRFWEHEVEVDLSRVVDEAASAVRGARRSRRPRWVVFKVTEDRLLEGVEWREEHDLYEPTQVRVRKRRRKARTQNKTSAQASGR